MATAYGIDLGTTYSAIAKLHVTGAPEMIADGDTGMDTLASAVFFKEDGSVIVGSEAKEEGATAPDRLKQFFKRWIGRGTDPNREHYLVDGKEYDPIELSTIVLGKIVEYAKAAGEDVKNVVITCPAYFDNAQRDATKQAGIAAGLNVMAIINEPTAAAISYCANRFNENQTVLVYDLGGGTFDVTLLKLTQNGADRDIDVLGTDGDAFLGGYEWDDELYQLFLEKYEEQYGISKDDIAEELKAAIRSAVEGLKMNLSNKERVKTKIPYDGENVVLEVTREEFESATAGYVERTVGWLNAVLEKANVTDDQVDVVLMVGGSTRMPMIKRMLTERFGERAIFNDPDKSVAKGAAIVADMKQKNAEVEMLKKLQQCLQDGSVRLQHNRQTGKLEISANDSTLNSSTDTNGEDNVEQTPKFDAELVDQLSEKLGEALSASNDGGNETQIQPATAIAIIGDQIKNTDKGNINVSDIAPRTFGLIVKRRKKNGQWEHFVDNIVHKGEKLPQTYTRIYETPEDDTIAIIIPVVESVSENKIDLVERGTERGAYIFPDSSLEMKQRNQLVLEVPVALPADSPINVEFKLDELGNVTLIATDPKSGVSEQIQFSFNETDQDLLDEIAKRQNKRVYANSDW